MNNMPVADKCIIREGFFPESIDEKDKHELFSFVSIDMDFEESTYQGLKFFMPRMATGGYVFLHDYNAKGIKNAVARYENETNEFLKGVHLSDMCGTFIITI